MLKGGGGRGKGWTDREGGTDREGERQGGGDRQGGGKTGRGDRQEGGKTGRGDRQEGGDRQEVVGVVSVSGGLVSVGTCHLWAGVIVVHGGGSLLSADTAMPIICGQGPLVLYGG
jgi:hypothetical protein